MILASLVANPLDDPYLWPTVIRIAAVLLIATVLVVAVERKSFRELRRTTLFQRVLSWAVMAPLFLAAMFFGGIVVYVFVVYVAVQGLAEYGRLVGLERRYAWLLVIGAFLTAFVAGVRPAYFLSSLLVFFVVLTVVPIVTGQVEGAHRQVTSALFGYVYLPFSLSYIVFIRSFEPDGLQMLVFIGVAVGLSDITAFVVGSMLKGKKLAPKVSPNKTWSGLIGNILGAYLALGLMWFIVPGEWKAVTVVAIPAVIGLSCCWGDLLESFIKRDFGVKDAGALLPGFGGVLDRIDSLLIALPVGYYSILIIERFAPG